MENNTEITNPGAPRKSNTLLIVFILLTAVFITTTIVFWMKSNNLRTEINTVVVEKETVNTEKDALVAKLDKLEDEYDSMGKEYENLDSLFTIEKARVKKMITEIKNYKGDLKNYKNKVASLEGRLKDYMVQIEELKAKNLELTTENLKVKTSLDSTIGSNELLANQNEDLTRKVDAGSVLKAYDMTCEAIRVKGDGKEIPTTKTKKVEKIRTCFILSENAIAQAGNKDILVRISGPDGTVITEANDDAHSFMYEGKKILYSVKKPIVYNNKAQDLCIYWDKKRTYTPGAYFVDIFIDGFLIGTSSFNLEK